MKRKYVSPQEIEERARRVVDPPNVPVRFIPSQRRCPLYGCRGLLDPVVYTPTPVSIYKPPRVRCDRCGKTIRVRQKG